jgi:hypothetical protein
MYDKKKLKHRMRPILNLCEDPNIRQDIITDGLCFYRSLLFCMGQLKDQFKSQIVSNYNGLSYGFTLSIDELKYNVNDENNIETIKTCCKLGFIIYEFLNRQNMIPEIRNGIRLILSSQDYQHDYFESFAFIRQGLRNFHQGAITGRIYFNPNLKDVYNNPLEWAGQLEIYVLGEILNLFIKPNLNLYEWSPKITLYVCYNGSNHYNGVKVMNLPDNFEKGRFYEIEIEEKEEEKKEEME